MMVSLYPTITAITAGTDLTIESVLADIQSGQWRTEVETVRRCETKTEQREAKKRLPYFTVSGTFDKRHDAGLKQHSGLVALDLDHVDLDQVRPVVEADAHTFAAFASVSGGGLCVIVRIPTTHHAESFRALQAYYAEQLGLTVDSLPDVSRPRFVSYDPELYFNAEADTFAELLAETPAKTPPRKPAAAPVLELRSTDTESILLAIGVKMIREAGDGGKHAKVRDAAFLMGGYVGAGFVSEGVAYDALYAAVLAKENVADLKNAEEAIRSGLAKGQLKPLLPDWLQMSVRKELREHDQAFGTVVTLAQTIAAKAHVPLAGVQAAVQAVAREQQVAEPILTFWNVVYKEGTRASLDTYKLVHSLEKFIKWMAAEGFRKYRSGTAYATVQVVGGVVHERDRGQLMDHVLAYINTLPFEFDDVYRFQVSEMVLALERKLFDANFLQALPSLEADFVRDTATAAHYFFANCWARVTATGITPYPYVELPGLIWAEQLRPHDFTPLFPLEAKACHFHQFTKNVSGGDADRLAILRAALGYLLHGYKEEANAKCIIFVDEVATTGKPDGRTGKSLLIKAVGELVKVTTIAGATFRFEDSFRFQRIQESTRVAYFDEWDGRRLPFKKLFTEITSELAVNRKNHAEFTIPFTASPKFAITTNDVVSGEGGSHEGRKIEIPLAPHYSSKHSPIDEFGQGFFADGHWQAEDWNYFFNLALGWVQDYLAAGRQLTQLASAALDARKLEDSTSPEFLEFAAELRAFGSGDAMDAVLWADAMYQRFLAYSGEAAHRFSMRRFYQWMGKVGFVRKQWKGIGMNRDKSYFEAQHDADAN